MTLWGAGPLPFPVSPWPLPSPSASSSSRRGLIAAGCGCGSSIALAAPQPAAGWWCAPRRCGGRGSCRRPMALGRCGGCEGRAPENRGACGARPSSQTAQQPQNPTARAKPNSLSLKASAEAKPSRREAVGPRARMLKNQEGGLGGGDSRGERRLGRPRSPGGGGCSGRRNGSYGDR